LNENIIQELVVGQLYSNEDIFRGLKVSNAGGIRLSLLGESVKRAAIMTSLQDFHAATENPYRDRLEGEILTYTAAGKTGKQTLSGSNSRLIGQRQLSFPIHGFSQIASRRNKSAGPKRWKYLGLLQYLRHYPDTQLDSDGRVRQVWLFEFRIHAEPLVIPLAFDEAISREVILASGHPAYADDDEVVSDGRIQSVSGIEQAERIRSKLLALDAKQFEFFIKDLLLHCRFTEVCVTKFSADGGIDVNARVGMQMWLFANTLVQVQAKRWLHSVGRKEVAELRGSLQPFARGAVVTTGHFSRAAIHEAEDQGKNPITLIDGLTLSRIVIDEDFHLTRQSGP
jgi:hypothetical protein